ncbi:MAG: hypothetical protein V4773_20340 [Verrucomicrobiota bacterium]
MHDRSKEKRGSVVVIVMITLLFATFALVTFMEKASVDLLVEQREVVSRRLRIEAYSALETTLAVLEAFRDAGQGLRGPAEGWGDPLGFVGYTPGEGRTVEIAFEDESGKISLPRADAQTLIRLFENWGITQADAEGLADAFMGWMKRDHVYNTSVRPQYDSGQLPFEAPLRSLRSFAELAAIEKVREMFYDADGRPNEYWKRFAESVSLIDFQRSNLNGATPDTLAALGRFNEQQRNDIGDHLQGKGSGGTGSPTVLQSPNDVHRITGTSGELPGFGVTISALRIVVTVREGRSEFRMATVVGPQGSAAKTVQETATSTKKETSSASAKTSQQQQNRPDASKAATPPPARGGSQQPNQPGTPGQGLKYPFTLLEIRENDEIPSAPTPPPAQSP